MGLIVKVDRMTWCVRVASRKIKVASTLDKLADVPGVELQNVNSTTAPREPHSHRVEFSTRLKSQEATDAVYQALRHASRVSQYWTVRPFSESPEESWCFAGWAKERIIVKNIDHIDFEIRDAAGKTFD